jgi:hypothetical protein
VVEVSIGGYSGGRVLYDYDVMSEELYGLSILCGEHFN